MTSQAGGGGGGLPHDVRGLMPFHTPWWEYVLYALAAVAVAAAFVIPGDGTGFFPTCYFKAMFALPCPGCGLTCNPCTWMFVESTGWRLRLVSTRRSPGRAIVGDR